MELRVLGTVELAAGDGRTPALPARLRRLLAALAVCRGEVVAADRLADALWGQEQPADGGAALHNLVSRLRRALAATGGQGRLHTRPPGYLLELAPGELDADRFEDLAGRGRAALGHDPAEAARLLDRAAGLWRGEAYAEFADEDFARPECARLACLRAAAAEDRVEADLLLARPVDAIARLAPVLADDPLRERAQAQLVLARYRAGQQAAALDAYGAYARRLGEELGLSPSAPLRDLQAAVLRHDPALDLPAPPAPPAPRAAIEDVAADTAGAAGAGVRASAGPGARLPTPPDLVGREEERAVLAALVRPGLVLTLTGPGGVGKTSLALRLAHDAAPGFPDGARLCELAALSDPGSVAEAVAAALGVQRRRAADARERLVEYLAPMRLLLVLDNCEHVLPAAAALADAVRAGAPGVAVLATSREPLETAVEHVHPLAPLPEAAATRLFLARARQAATGFDVDAGGAEAVAAVCRRLDGLPLAIELAANRMRVMSPADLADRLSWRLRLLRGGPRSAPARHRSLGALVDWSYTLLDATEQQVFEALTVFASAFSLAAAEAVVAGGGVIDVAGAAPADVDEVVLRLVDRSMVTADTSGRTSRYAVLETLRAYGRPLLAARPYAQAVHRAHAGHYADLVTDLAGRLFGPEHAEAVRAIDAVVDELRAAHGWALEHDPPLAARLVGSLARYVECRMAAEVPRWAERSLERAGLLAAAEAGASSATGAADADVVGSAAAGRPDADALARAAGVAAAGARFAGDLDTVRRLVAVGMPLARSDDAAAYLHFLAAEVALFDGDLDEAGRQAERLSRLVARGALGRFGDVALGNEVLAAAYAGDTGAALSMADRMRLRAQRSGARLVAAWADYLTGETLLDADPARAERLLRDAVRVARQQGDGYLDGVALVSLATVQSRYGRAEDAVPPFREVVEHWRRVGDWTHQWTTVRGVVDLLVRRGSDEAAAVLLGAVRSRTTAATVYGDDAARLRDAERLLTARLGEAALRAATGRGEAMRDEDVVGHVLAALR